MKMKVSVGNDGQGGSVLHVMVDDTTLINRRFDCEPEGLRALWKNIADAVNRDEKVEKLVKGITGFVFETSSAKRKILGGKVMQLYKPKPRTVGDLDPKGTVKVKLTEKPDLGYIYVRVLDDECVKKEEHEVVMFNLDTYGICLFHRNTPCEPAEEK